MDADKRITFPELTSIFSGSDLAVSPVRCRNPTAQRPLKSARAGTEITESARKNSQGSNLLTAKSVAYLM